MQAIFAINGLPELNARLDKIARIVANPITREALEKGGEVVQKRAEDLVHRLTGTLQRDIVVVTRVRESGFAVGESGAGGGKYVLIGPAWNPDVFRRTAPRRTAAGRDVRPDYTTNPGVYGYFLEVGHRSPGKGLNSDKQYKRDSYAARKQGKRLNSYTNPSSRGYGQITTPPYPWLQPAFDQTEEQAFEVMGGVIRERLEGLGLL